MRSRKKRQLTKAELRAMGATPGLVATRYHAGGERAEIRQLAPEGPQRRKDLSADSPTKVRRVKELSGWT